LSTGPYSGSKTEWKTLEIEGYGVFILWKQDAIEKGMMCPWPNETKNLFLF